MYFKVTSAGLLAVNLQGFFIKKDARPPQKLTDDSLHINVEIEPILWTQKSLFLSLLYYHMMCNKQ